MQYQMPAEISKLTVCAEWITIIFSILSFFVLGWIAVLTLRFTATPKINITLRNSKSGRLECRPSEKLTLTFDLKNVGRCYARPPTKNVILYLNFPEPFELIEARYGSALERSQTQVRIGKRYDDLFSGNMKYFRVDGITLFYGEPGETVEVHVKTPDNSGIYPLRIAAHSDERGYQVCLFQVKVSGGSISAN
jgi:hypothetical protein